MKAIIDECGLGNKAYFKKFFDFLYKKYNISSKKEINLLFCSIDKIKELNKQYRRKKSPTDVLSFYGYDDNILGDIAICCEVASKKAKKLNMDEKEYILFLIAHGFLHLLGYNHDTMQDYETMVNLQKQLLREWS
ncbi:Metal-dependent hydrolase YbeY, involved in rRNA and/or ribosome maturation and assembly [Desulfurella amilsii]|uniref:Endoribonuclease YbeY n=1 Tax=Desulfurella amilsii TaxID=1562698 RepID=A0A1X4Y022_9BACT|nr:rRNA maturation RNase YbeY [Desulfurella amilsii]OSS43135.1 Metal-dependent hydrolase YbeY, involved in rRNA and/or ribosome maturation and assembly [Desulfurella amilsii]